MRVIFHYTLIQKAEYDLLFEVITQKTTDKLGYTNIPRNICN